MYWFFKCLKEPAMKSFVKFIRKEKSVKIRLWVDTIYQLLGVEHGATCEWYHWRNFGTIFWFFVKWAGICTYYYMVLFQQSHHKISRYWWIKITRKITTVKERYQDGYVKKRADIFSYEQIKNFLENANDEGKNLLHKSIVCIALYGGLRRADVSICIFFNIILYSITVFK